MMNKRDQQPIWRDAKRWKYFTGKKKKSRPSDYKKKIAGRFFYDFFPFLFTLVSHENPWRFFSTILAEHYFNILYRESPFVVSIVEKKSGIVIAFLIFEFRMGSIWYPSIFSFSSSWYSESWGTQQRWERLKSNGSFFIRCRFFLTKTSFAHEDEIKKMQPFFLHHLSCCCCCWMFWDGLNRTFKECVSWPRYNFCLEIQWWGWRRKKIIFYHNFNFFTILWNAVKEKNWNLSPYQRSVRLETRDCFYI